MRKDNSAKTPSSFSEDDIVSLNSDDIKKLEEGIINEKSSSYRICLHKNPEDSFHQMIIAHSKKFYYRPHKHSHKPEAYHMIKGIMGCFIFDDEGLITEKCVLL